MMKLENYPEFNAAVENLRSLEDEWRQSEQGKIRIQDEANAASPATRVAFHQSWREEYQELERAELAARRD